MEFDIYVLIDKLRQKRQLFVSEADFQLELAWVIKEQYPSATVRLEYCPQFDSNMHIDILVILDGQWIPIELKYKTKKYIGRVGDEFYSLKNHSAKDINCYAYLKDIQRIETVQNNVPSFREGYAIFLTNELSYLKEPAVKSVNYYQFSLHENCAKEGILDWGEHTGAGTKGKECNLPIELSGKYQMHWLDYSLIDKTSAGCFKILINKVC